MFAPCILLNEHDGVFVPLAGSHMETRVEGSPSTPDGREVSGTRLLRENAKRENRLSGNWLMQKNAEKENRIFGTRPMQGNAGRENRLSGTLPMREDAGRENRLARL